MSAAPDHRRVGRDILATLRPPGIAYYLVVAFLVVIVGIGFRCWLYQFETGMGVSGLMHPVMWGVYITNFVFWVGIAHSGTLISAILYLFRARWRTTVYRSAEAMTLFAVMTAGLFPLIHLGRPWLFYYLIPYPNQRELWVNFRSPLVWDFFAIGTYFTVSALFLFLGLIPDVAAARDQASGRWRRRFYAALALGWSGSGRQWRHYQSAYLLLAALATPLVVSVHSVVSWDFAVAGVPGWHSTISAPYFVAGAIFSGVAMVITLLVPLRRLFRLELYITPDHFDQLAKVLLTTSLIVTYAYVVEAILPWYADNVFELAVLQARASGPNAPLFWLMIFCNSILPLTLWWRRVRRSVLALLVVSLFVNVGMWLERFVIIVSSLAQEYEPFSWGTYQPSFVEVGITAGSFAWFLLLFFLFVKFLPAVSITEIREQHEEVERVTA